MANVGKGLGSLLGAGEQVSAGRTVGSSLASATPNYWAQLSPMLEKEAMDPTALASSANRKLPAAGLVDLGKLFDDKLGIDPSGVGIFSLVGGGKARRNWWIIRLARGHGRYQPIISRWGWHRWLIRQTRI